MKTLFVLAIIAMSHAYVTDCSIDGCQVDASPSYCWNRACFFPEVDNSTCLSKAQYMIRYSQENVPSYYRSSRDQILGPGCSFYAGRYTDNDFDKFCGYIGGVTPTPGNFDTKGRCEIYIPERSADEKKADATKACHEMFSFPIPDYEGPDAEREVEEYIKEKEAEQRPAYERCLCEAAGGPEGCKAK